MFFITYNTRIFSALKSHFSNKRLCPWKKFQRGKFFEIDIFVLKHVLDHSKSITTKKIRFFSFFCHFWPFLGPKISIFLIFEGAILKFLSPILKGLCCGHFALLYAPLRLSSFAGSLDLSIFFRKNFLYPLLELFIAVLFYHHTYMYLNPSRRARQMSSFIPPPPLRFTKCGVQTKKFRS